MSTGDQVSDSTSNFNEIFQTACDHYRSLTGHDLNRHPFATQLGNCDSPDAVVAVIRKQAETFIKRRRKYEKFLSVLSPIVNVLFLFSATLAEGVGMVSFHQFCAPLLKHSSPSHFRLGRQYLLVLVFFSG
jgi:hypothetical protein